MKERRPARAWRFGEVCPIEREIIAEIIFRREQKQPFSKIADDLNAQGKWPRRAKKWSWALVYHVHKCNKKPPGSKENNHNESGK
jgi:hypothetical protein